jgi:outer membrane protein
MKYRLGTIMAVFLGVGLVSTASAQQLRVGYVDMKRVLDNAPQVIAGRDMLDQEFRPRNDSIEADAGRADSLELRLHQGDMAEDRRLQMDRELRDMRRNINRRREDLRDELSFRRTEEVQRLEEQINIAVQEIARQNGYDLILSSPVIYADPALDITAIILDQLQLEYDADRAEQAQR